MRGWLVTQVNGMTLQVAVKHHVFLFDMTVLPMEPGNTLDECLTRLMTSSQVIKLGCGISGDLKQLASAFPSTQAFKRVAGVVELR